MKKALIIGGTSGIGLALTFKLIEKDYYCTVVGKKPVDFENISEKFSEIFQKSASQRIVDLTLENFKFLDSFKDIDTLIITSGFGRVAHFEDLHEKEISNLVKCNQIAPMQILKRFFDKIKSKNDFYSAVLGSIAGHVASPLFSVYGSSKRGLCSFIENINIELIAQNFPNRILDVSPGHIKGTSFDGNKNDLEILFDLADLILNSMFNKELLLIPRYKEVYKSIVSKYNESKINFGVESYNYKIKNARIRKNTQLIIGYLSGTFDLFHIGHLNLIFNARKECDYLIVGLHESGAWKNKETFIPFDERKRILESIKYVDKVIKSHPEDHEAWFDLKYNKLFVGSDYKGSDRFLRYENFFKDKDVKIVYFPYTPGTSSSKLRKILSEKIKKL